MDSVIAVLYDESTMNTDGVLINDGTRTNSVSSFVRSLYMEVRMGNHASSIRAALGIDELNWALGAENAYYFWLAHNRSPSEDEALIYYWWHTRNGPPPCSTFEVASGRTAALQIAA